MDISEQYPISFLFYISFKTKLPFFVTLIWNTFPSHCLNLGYSWISELPNMLNIEWQLLVQMLYTCVPKKQHLLRCYITSKAII